METINKWHVCMLEGRVCGVPGTQWEGAHRHLRSPRTLNPQRSPLGYKAACSSHPFSSLHPFLLTDESCTGKGKDATMWLALQVRTSLKVHAQHEGAVQKLKDQGGGGGYES